MSRSPRGGVIAHVWPGSIGDELDLRPGDVVLAIDGQPLADVVDYKTLIASETPLVHIRRSSGEEWEIEVEKEPEEDLGITFAEVAFDGLRRCKNRCQFCFVDQMPPGLRSTLYVKDDDYRLSFCQGSYITLTNMSAADIDRIARLRLSPLYVSVHATDPAVRQRIMGHPRAGEIMQLLRRLTDAGVEIHAQIVLCPGINDGSVLVATLDDLASLAPKLRTVSVVPVGLSAYRQGLAPLAPHTRSSARQALALIHRKQAEFFARFGTRLVFAADELYLCAGEEMPQAQSYEDFEQLEDGIGLVRLLWDEAERALSAMEDLRGVTKGKGPESFLLVTGQSGAAVLQPLALRLAALGIPVTVLPVTNAFLGERITVAGLLSGLDVGKAIAAFISRERLRGRRGAFTVLLPEVMFRTGQGKTLDGLDITDIERLAGVPLEALPISGSALIDRLHGIRFCDSEMDGDTGCLSL